MAVRVRVQRVVNKGKPKPKPKATGKKKKKKSAPAHKKRSKPRNPVGPLVSLGAINKQKREEKAAMAQKKAKKKNVAQSKPAKKKNVARAPAKRNKPKKPGRKRNIRIKPIGMLQTGLFALIGLVLTRQLPQLALGTRNTGIIGYLSNVAAALVASFGVQQFTNKKNGAAVLIGGMLYLVNRIITEQFAPVGKILSLAGLGDAQAAGLGRIREGYFPLPVVVTRDGRPVIPRAIVQASVAEMRRTAPVVTAGSNMKGLRKGLRYAA